MSKFATRALRTLALLTFVADIAHAQQTVSPVGGYPNKPVRIIVAVAPGGSVDSITRAVALKLGERLGTSIVVDNRSGANGIIAMDLIAHAVPDGYTIMSASYSIVPNGVQKKVSYDIRTAYAPVVQMTSQSFMFMVHPSLPANSLKEFIALAKSKPGGLSYASAGAGSVTHLGTELFKSMAGIDMVHVPYKGTALAVADLIGGHVHMTLTAGLGSTPHLKSGKLKALAVTSTQRLRGYPDLPTVSEAGVPGFEWGNSYSLYAPAKTPAAILNLINREVTQIMHTPEMTAKLTADGSEAAAQISPEEFKKKFSREFDKWDRILKETNIKL